MIDKKIVASGKRKSAIAKATLTSGSGNVTVNGRDHKNLHLFDKLKIEEPLRIYNKIIGSLNFNASIIIRGGGEKGQIDAARLSLSKAMVNFSKSDLLVKSLNSYDRNLLVADVRRKETCKPGDSKARSKRQSSKR